ncbi:hypothetical protein JW766_05810 [Candidatus Dojkabacteria bacterium]|nr:hypothetical protein [Candidatus Dojkabacteria bacterium]
MSKLVPEVVAQSEPTFPYEGPWEQPGPEPTPPGEAIVKLTSDTSSLQIDQTVTCDLRIESGNEEIQNYSISLSFNSSILEVVDADTTQSGVQINFLDSFSTLNTNTADNSAGTITITASISGAAQTINRRLAQITFKAKRSGTSIVSVNKAQSSVMNDVSQDVLGTTTSLNFTVTGQTQTTDEDQLPSSGLSDVLATFGSATAALLMLFIGIKALVERKKEKEPL